MGSKTMIRPKVKRWLASVLVCCASVSASAQDRIVTLEGTRIRGDQEVPLVLYLVPWKAPEARSLNRADEPLMLTRPIRPIARSEFRRLMDYHNTFKALNAVLDTAEESGQDPR